MCLMFKYQHCVYCRGTSAKNPTTATRHKQLVVQSWCALMACSLLNAFLKSSAVDHCWTLEINKVVSKKNQCGYQLRIQSVAKCAWLLEPSGCVLITRGTKGFLLLLLKKKWSKKIFSNIAWPSTKRMRLCVWIQVWCCEQFLFHGQFWCQGLILLFAFAVIIIHFIYNNFKTCIWNREANNVVRKDLFFSQKTVV